MMHFKNNSAFTLIEVMLALAIAASLLTSIYIMQSGALVGTIRYALTYRRIIYAKNFLLNTRRAREEKKEIKQFKLEKHEEDPETYLHYSFNSTENSSLKDFKNLYIEKVDIMHDSKQKEPSGTLLTFVYIPEATQ